LGICAIPVSDKASTPERQFYEQLMAATIRANAGLTLCWRRPPLMPAPPMLMERAMIEQFSQILRYHPAYLSGPIGQLEGGFEKYEGLEQKPCRRSERRTEVGDRLSFVGGVATLIGLLVLLAAALVA
jgi:hypothetical protein